MRKICKFLLATAAFVSTAAHAEFIDESKINTATALGDGTVDFNFGGGEGHSSSSVILPAAAGSNCLRMWMFVEATKKGPDSFGPSFVIDTTGKTCRMQMHPIGA